MSAYQKKIETILHVSGLSGVPARQVEAYMRMLTPCLDSLSVPDFDRMARQAAHAVRADGWDTANAVADLEGV